MPDTTQAEKHEGPTSGNSPTASGSIGYTAIGTPHARA